MYISHDNWGTKSLRRILCRMQRCVKLTATLDAGRRNQNVRVRPLDQEGGMILHLTHDVKVRQMNRNPLDVGQTKY